MQVIFDHVGYEPDTPIRLLVEAPADTVWDALAVVRLPSGNVIAEPAPQFAGYVDGWSCGPWWSVVVDGISASGRYALHWRAGGRSGQSEGFTVAERAHGDQLVSDIVHYIKGQRCSGVWDAADRSAPRVGDACRA